MDRVCRVSFEDHHRDVHVCYDEELFAEDCDIMFWGNHYVSAIETPRYTLLVDQRGGVDICPYCEMQTDPTDAYFEGRIIPTRTPKPPPFVGAYVARAYVLPHTRRNARMRRQMERNTAMERFIADAVAHARAT
jgi:hypothetical protein